MPCQQYSEIGPLIESLPKGSGLVGLDLEADSLYRYSEKICLIQICFGDQVELIDPLASCSVGNLVDWIENAEVWMHGADYDMTLMLREWKVLPKTLFDTQIAAQLLGHERFGYASLVNQYFGVELSKSSQKADWGKRPLSSTMLEYARNDVRYLLPLANLVSERLRELGRYDWFLESCHAAQVKVRARESEVKELWKISGSGKLKPEGLSFLKCLWEWRDAEAAEWNRPSFMVAPNRMLLAWAADLAAGREVDFPLKLRNDRKERLRAAINLARKVPQKDWPRPTRRERIKLDEKFDSKLKQELEKRNLVAQSLGLDPSVIASRGVLERVVSGRENPEVLLLRWQRELLGF